MRERERGKVKERGRGKRGGGEKKDVEGDEIYIYIYRRERREEILPWVTASLRAVSPPFALIYIYTFPCLSVCILNNS